MLGAGGLAILDLLSIKVLAQLGVSGVDKAITSKSIVDIVKAIVNAQVSVLKTEYSLSIVRYVPLLLAGVLGSLLICHYIKEKD